ncbi:helix-turn-helix transcriptional regulator [Sutcliffiella horikoshii]|uniref:helix-turn-helix domain-containing protein n=1 Tax=Sutcliffiella horikoshii TaxID=79883 RepID=UPI00384C0B02
MAETGYKPMKDSGFIPILPKTLEEIGLTRNGLAVEAKVRPASITDLYNGETRTVHFETLQTIIDTLNRLGFEKGLSRRFTIEDIFTYDARTKKSSE